MIDMETMLQLAAVWFIISIPLAFWGGWTLRQHAPRDLDKTLAPRDADLLRLNGWRR